MATAMVNRILSQVFAQIGPSTTHTHHHTFAALTHSSHEKLGWGRLSVLVEVVKLHGTLFWRMRQSSAWHCWCEHEGGGWGAAARWRDRWRYGTEALFCLQGQRRAHGTAVIGMLFGRHQTNTRGDGCEDRADLLIQMVSRFPWLIGGSRGSGACLAYRRCRGFFSGARFRFV